MKRISFSVTILVISFIFLTKAKAQENVDCNQHITAAEIKKIFKYKADPTVSVNNLNNKCQIYWLSQDSQLAGAPFSGHIYISPANDQTDNKATQEMCDRTISEGQGHAIGVADMSCYFTVGSMPKVSGGSPGISFIKNNTSVNMAYDDIHDVPIITNPLEKELTELAKLVDSKIK